MHAHARVRWGDGFELRDAVAGRHRHLDLAFGHRFRHVFRGDLCGLIEAARRVEGVQEPLGIGERRRSLRTPPRSHAARASGGCSSAPLKQL
jgi:hypothetical protein